MGLSCRQIRKGPCFLLQQGNKLYEDFCGDHAVPKFRNVLIKTTGKEIVSNISLAQTLVV